MDYYLEKWKKEQASKEQLEYLDLALKIYGHCSMGVFFEYTDDVHLDYLTNALIEVDDQAFIEKLREVKTEEDYLELKIPNNEVLKYYMEDGKDNIKFGKEKDDER